MWRLLFFGVIGLGILMSISGGVSMALDKGEATENYTGNWLIHANTMDHQIELIEVNTMTHHPIDYWSRLESVTADPIMLQLVGDNLYFYAQDEQRIYRMNINGDDSPKLVSTTVPYGAFSPDAQWIYSLDGLAIKEIYRMSLDGVSREQLTTTYYPSNPNSLVTGAFTLSPDGNWLAYNASSQSLNNPISELWLLTTDSAASYRLTDYPLNSYTWSADSQWIAVTYQDTLISPLDARLYNAATYETRDLPLELWQFRGAIAVAPGAENIVFAGNCGDDINIVTCLFKVEADGTVSGELFRINGTIENLSYSPDGQWLTFYSATNMGVNDYQQNFYSVRPDGSNLQLLAPILGSISALHWVSPATAINLPAIIETHNNNPSLPQFLLITGFGFIFGGVIGGLIARKIHLARTAPKIKTKRPYFVDA